MPEPYSTPRKEPPKEVERRNGICQTAGPVHSAVIGQIKKHREYFPVLTYFFSLYYTTSSMCQQVTFLSMIR